MAAVSKTPVRSRGARLLERDHEISELEALLGDATAGGGRLLMVEGPAGIGKTQLLAELQSQAEAHGARVLSARGSELDAAVPGGLDHRLAGLITTAGR